MNCRFVFVSLLGVIGIQLGVAASRPNILFIAVDDLRPSIGSYGDALAVTPNIDRLADQGVQFNRAYCQVAVCNPSRASLMTGLRPDQLNVWTLSVHFREAMPDAVTIPQWFRQFGYTAVSHGKIYHNPTPDPQSWSEPIRPGPKLPSPYSEGSREVVRAKMAALPDDDWRKNNLRFPSTAAPDLPDNRVLDGARTDMAIEDLKRLGREKEPFFLAMGFIRPHLAWVAPKRYWDMHDPEKLPVLNDEKINPDTPRYALHNNSELRHYVDLMNLPAPWDPETVSPAKARQLVHAYYACVSYVDAQIGRLMDALVEEGLADNTIVVLWSDHGWKLGEYRGWGKMTNYEIDARVPLIISTPGMATAGRQTEQLAELLDLFPTLCELAGIETPDFVAGESLVPTLEDPQQPVRSSAVNQYFRRMEGREYLGYSIRTDTHRLTEWRDFKTGEVLTRELYDHRHDHSETVNIVDAGPSSLVDEMVEELLLTHPRRGFSLVPDIHSRPKLGMEAADISFSNKSGSAVKLFRISANGQRSRSRTSVLKQGEELTIEDHVGGVFVVESNDGRIHEVHTATIPSEPIVLK